MSNPARNIARRVRRLVSAAAVFMAFALPAFAGGPYAVTYQGTLRLNNAVHNGVVGMTFRITDQSGTTEYWLSNSTSVVVNKGIFRYILGVDSAQGYSFVDIPWGAIDPYLEVRVGAATVSRERFYATPYALYAKHVEGAISPASSNTFTGANVFAGRTEFTSDMYVGQSTISAQGYLTLKGLLTPPPAAPGLLYFSSADGSFRVSPDGVQYYPLLTSVAADGEQFSGQGVAGAPLELKASSVTLQGNVFNAADKLVKLDSSGALPAVSGAALTNLNAAGLTGAVPAASVNLSTVQPLGNYITAIIGDVSATGPIGGGAAAAALSPTGVSAGAYGSGSMVGVFTVDAKGRISAATNVLITGAAPTGAAGGDLSGNYPNPAIADSHYSAPHTWSGTQTFSDTIAGSISGNAATVTNGIYTTTAAAGDLTGNYPNPELAATPVTSGSYGTSTEVAQFTVDAKGRIISATNVLITGAAPTGAAGGDLSGNYPNPAIADSHYSASHTWSGTQTFNSPIIGNISGNAETVTNGIYTTTAAGGDLTGNYPNP
ncbi:MAG: hypothetical protein WC421_11400, partial [Elusimicrobiales bacterium]